MAKHKTRVVIASTGGTMFTVAVSALALRLSTWANLHHSALTAATITGLIGAAAAALGWILTKDDAEKVAPEPIPAAPSKTQKARDVSGQMFQADNLYYTEVPNQAERLDLDLEVKEFAFHATRTGGQQIFILVKVFLRTPHLLEVAYSLSVVAHGRATPLDTVFDMDQWMYVERRTVGQYHGTGVYMEARPMPTTIEAGVYAEGWLHFVSAEVTDTEVGKSHVRLLANTTAGKKEIERQGVSIVGTRYMMRRKDLFK
jgi:hypothetical protein